MTISKWQGLSANKLKNRTIVVKYEAESVYMSENGVVDKRMTESVNTSMTWVDD